jgi:hypothetical protein
MVGRNKQPRLITIQSETIHELKIWKYGGNNRANVPELLRFVYSY